MMVNDGQSGQIHSCRQTSDIPVLVLRSIPERPDAAIVCEALALGDAVRIDGAGARNKRELFRRVTAVGFGAWQMHRMGREYLRSWTVVTT